MLRKIFFVLTVLTIINVSNSLNILFIFTFFGRSHYFVFEPLVKELSKIGHNVTVITNVNDVIISEEYRLINMADEIQNKTGILSMDYFTGDRMDIYHRPIHQIEISEMCCSRLNNKVFQSFLKEKLTFDIVLAEVFNTNCFFGALKKYTAPIIGLSSTDILPWMSQWFGTPENPSYIPVLFLDHADQLNFFHRVENTLMLLYSKFVHLYYIGPSGNEYSKKYLGIDLYEGGDIMYNLSMLLVNRHYTFQTPKPLSPNVIEVGGIHIETPKKLPKDLEQIVENSPHGVILMSMGSTLKGTTFPEKQRKMFLKVFSQLKETVIWKWENDTMEELPKNVILYKWVPQLDLLCNPNVKLFITHGGLLGSQEAVNCGVPMLIIPQFADQHLNAAALAKSGVSVNIKLRTATESILSDALQKGLSPKFAENAKLLSERFKDRPMSPMDTAIYWIEYVARHKGAPFMRTAVTDMPFYQYLLLDVIAFLISLLVIFIYVLYVCVKFIVILIFYFKSVPKMKTN